MLKQRKIRLMNVHHPMIVVKVCMVIVDTSLKSQSQHTLIVVELLDLNQLGDAFLGSEVMRWETSHEVAAGFRIDTNDDH